MIPNKFKENHMRFHGSTVIIGLLISGCLMAADITATITSYPKEILQGLPIPVTLEIKNVSGVPLAVACGGVDFHTNFVTRHSSGKPRENCEYSVATTTAFQWDAMVLKPGLYQEYTIDARCDDAPGTVTLQLVVRSGICPNYDESKQTYGVNQTHHKPGPKEKPWGGEVKSDEVKIVILQPKGVDAQAYEAFNHKPLSSGYWRELIQKYPTSVYAGYQFKQIHWYLRGHSASSQENLDTLTSPDYLKKFTLIADPFCDDSNVVPTVPSRQAVKDRIKLFREYLQAHPDFPLREDYHLDWWLAEAYLIDGRYQDAYESFDWIAKNAKDKNSVKSAESMRTAMVKKGVVSESK